MHIIDAKQGAVCLAVFKLCVVPVIQDADLPPEGLGLRLPRLFSVVGDIRKADRIRVEKQRRCLSAERRMRLSKRNQPAHKGEVLCLLLCLPPVKPRNRIILTVGIVIASLAVPELVTGEK